MLRKGTSSSGSSDTVLAALRAVRNWRGVGGAEIHRYFIKNVPFELNIERYVTIRHLSYWVDVTDDQRCLLFQGSWKVGLWPGNTQWNALFGVLLLKGRVDDVNGKLSWSLIMENIKNKAQKAALLSGGSGWEPWDWKWTWLETDFRKIKLIAVPGPPTAFHLTSLKSQFQCHFLRESSPIPKAWLNAHAIHSHSILYFSSVNLVSLFRPPLPPRL